MIGKDGVKRACVACIRGHRVTKCTHKDKELHVVAPKGRPVTQCHHCRTLRVSRAAHSKCDCGEHAHAAGACPKTMDAEHAEIDMCCCSHGGRCKCSLKKEPQLNSVPEAGVDDAMTSAQGATLERPKLNTSKSEGNNLTVFTQGGHHKPAQKHNQMAHTSGLPYTVPRAHSHASAAAAKLKAAETLGVRILPKPLPPRLITNELGSTTESSGEPSPAGSDTHLRKTAALGKAQQVNGFGMPSQLETQACKSASPVQEQERKQLSPQKEVYTRKTASPPIEEHAPPMPPLTRQPEEIPLDYSFPLSTNDGQLTSDFDPDLFFPQQSIDWAQYGIFYNHDDQFTTSEFSHTPSLNMFSFNNAPAFPTPSTSGDQSEIDFGLNVAQCSSRPPEADSQFDAATLNELGDFSSASSLGSVSQYQPFTSKDFDNIDTNEFLPLQPNDIQPDLSTMPLSMSSSYSEATKFAEMNPFEGNGFQMPEYLGENSVTWEPSSMLSGSTSTPDLGALATWQAFGGVGNSREVDHWVFEEWKQ